MRNEYYMWRVSQWVYKRLDYHLCEDEQCKNFKRALAAKGEPKYLFKKKEVNGKMARFIILAADKGYLEVWRCEKEGLTYTSLTDEGLNLTNHILYVPTGLIKLLLKENKVIMTLLITTLITALSQLSIIGLVKDLIGKM